LNEVEIEIMGLKLLLILTLLASFVAFNNGEHDRLEKEGTNAVGESELNFRRSPSRGYLAGVCGLHSTSRCRRRNGRLAMKKRGSKRIQNDLRRHLSYSAVQENNDQEYSVNKKRRK